MSQSPPPPAGHVTFCRSFIDEYGRHQARQLPARRRARIVERQAERAAHLVAAVRSGNAVLVDDPVGTGKTVVTLAAAARLLDLGWIDRVLVVAPNVTVAHQWEERARSANQGIRYFQRVARDGRGPWQQGMLRAVTRSKLTGPPPGAARYLVIVDEAHRGLQHPGGLRDRLLEWREAAELMLVTATPFQLSMTGLTTMLSVGKARPGDLKALEGYGRKAAEALRRRSHAAGPGGRSQADGPLRQAQDGHQQDVPTLRNKAEEALRRYRPPGNLGEALGVPPPPRLDDPNSLRRLPVDPRWRDAFEVARLVPELVGCGKGDAFQRRLVSSSEAFWAGKAGTALESHANHRAVRDFVRALRQDLGTGAGHPKVRATAERAAEWAAGGRHVVIFCTWIESADAIYKALRQRSGRSWEVKRPTGTTVGPAVVTRLSQPPGAGEPPLVLVLTDRFSESIDLDGGRPCLIHHDLPWNPARLRQRWGRLVRAASGFEAIAAEDVFIPVLDVYTDRRLHETVVKRARIGDAVLLPIEPDDQGLDPGDDDDGVVFEGDNFEWLAGH